MSIHFEVSSKLNKKIKVTERYWNIIVSLKHPSMLDKENLVKETLMNPDEIRKSKKEQDIYLYYKSKNKVFICVVCKHLNGDGFIITTYTTNIIKEGELVWKKY